jgi:hypothetical protein
MNAIVSPFQGIANSFHGLAKALAMATSQTSSPASNGLRVITGQASGQVSSVAAVDGICNLSSMVSQAGLLLNQTQRLTQVVLEVGTALRM